MRADDPAVRTPPTIQALLAARIDALPRARAPSDRGGVDRGSRVPPRRRAGARRPEAHASTPPSRRSCDASSSATTGPSSPARPATASRTSWCATRPTTSWQSGAAPTCTSAYADWLLGRDDRGSAADEIVGYHLEQAHEYRSQLGRAGDERHHELAARASGHLSDAGRRALSAGDRGGASNLLERAVALLPRTDPDRAALLIDLGGVHREQGRFRESEAALREARALAVDAGDGPLRPARRSPGSCRASRSIRTRSRGSCAGRARRSGAGARGGGRPRGPRAALAPPRRCSGGSRHSPARPSGPGGGPPTRRCMAGDARMLADARRVGGVIHGRRADARRRGDRPLRRDPGDPEGRPLGGGARASAAGEPARDARANSTTAFALLDESAATLAGFGPTVDAAVSHPEVFVAMLAGDLERAERHLRTGRRVLERMGERAVLASTEGYLAQVAARGRTRPRGGPARAALRRPRDRRRRLAAGRSGARCGRACSHGRGQTRRALELAREAVEIAMTTDHLNDPGATRWSTWRSCRRPPASRTRLQPRFATAVGSTRRRATRSARGKRGGASARPVSV